MFYGRSFIYNGVASEMYGLYISDIDASAINNAMASNSMEIQEQKIFRRSVPYFYGSTPSPKLTFDFSAYSDGEIDAELFSLISKWLFSSRTYKIFQIDQYDLQSSYFKCILSEPNVNKVGNIIQGFTCKVICDAPFMWKFPSTTTYTYTTSSVNSAETFYNSSDDAGYYLFPSLVITMNNVGGDVSITNNSDGGRIFQFTNLAADEIITVNNSLQTMSSSTGLKRLSNFNKKFLRLVSGLNNLVVQGDVASIAMTTQFVSKKI